LKSTPEAENLARRNIVKSISLCCALAALLAAASALPAQESTAQRVWDVVRQKSDANNDGQITRAEWKRGAKRFERLDKNKDGVITQADFVQKRSRGRRGRPTPAFVFSFLMDTDKSGSVDLQEVKGWVKKHDQNKDGQITADEVTPARAGRFVVRMLDKDESQSVSLAEFTTAFQKEAKNGIIKASRRGRRRPSKAPKVGEVAPDFTLKYKDGVHTATLSSFKGKKPVALIFGSYT